MSTLDEIEEAITRLSAPQIEELVGWLEQWQTKPIATNAPEPDFYERSKALWGEQPTEKLLSELVSDTRANRHSTG